MFHLRHKETSQQASRAALATHVCRAGRKVGRSFCQLLSRIQIGTWPVSQVTPSRARTAPAGGPWATLAVEGTRHCGFQKTEAKTAGIWLQSRDHQGCRQFLGPGRGRKAYQSVWLYNKNHNKVPQFWRLEFQGRVSSEVSLGFADGHFLLSLGFFLCVPIARCRLAPNVFLQASVLDWIVTALWALFILFFFLLF